MEMAIKNIKNKFPGKTTLKRTIFFLLGDIILIALSCYLGFLLRFDGAIEPKYFLMIKGFIAIAVPLTVFFFVLERLYSISWSFVSVRELLKLFRAIIASFLGVGAVLFIFRNHHVFEGFPRSIIFISGFLTLLLTGGFRFSKRIYLHGFKKINRNGKNNKAGINPILIIGAGDAGEQIARHIISSDVPYSLIGFIDDNPTKQGLLIHGIKVVGKIKDIPEIVKKHQIKEVIIAMPIVSKKIIKQTVDLARQSGVQKIKIIPSTAEILAEKVSLNHLREISIEDLLGRESVKIDTQSIQNYITGKIVLITGAAGSIGSVLCEQVLKFQPKQLITLDQSETGTFHLQRNLNKLFPNIEKSFILADICDKNKINQIFENLKPNVVFHAAAYKHVPVMEDNPEEAVKNNIFGTLTLGQAALKNNTEKFVMISTDKAINPTSVMGASKQVCEKICVWLNKGGDSPKWGQAPSEPVPEVPQTKFCAVRFGNVLGSQGSVVPIFEKQIKKGGPVEVTDPEMKRYFMVTAEACLLVMQAGAIGQDGQVFVLDMGQPIKIVDLAREMIRLAGYQPDVDIPIVFTGIRPGEKLFEEILTKTETPTKYEKIFIAKLDEIDEQKLLNALEQFKQALEKMDKPAIISILNELAPIQA